MKATIPGLYLKKGYYYFRGPQVEGVRPSAVALRTQDLGEALDLIADMRQQAMIAATKSPMDELVKAWLDAKAASHDHSSAQTTRTARPALRRFLGGFRCRAAEVSPDGIEKWKRGLLNEGLSPATVAGYMRYAQSFFSWLVERGQVVRNPFSLVTFPRSLPTKRDVVCSKSERDRQIANCTDADPKAMLFFGFHAGLRRQEILNLRREWLVCDAAGVPRHLRIQNERADEGRADFAVKDRETKVVQLSDPLIAFLVGEYGMQREPYLIAPQFVPGRHEYRWDFKRRFSTYVKRQGLPWVTPHVMRHTFVSLLLSAPPDRRPSLLHISRWTGTGEAVLRRTYAHLFDDPGLINAAN